MFRKIVLFIARKSGALEDPEPLVETANEEVPRIPVLDNTHRIKVTPSEYFSIKTIEAAEKPSIRFIIADADRKDTNVLFAECKMAKSNVLVLQSITAPLRDYLTVEVCPTEEHMIKGFVHNTQGDEVYKIEGDIDTGVLTLTSNMLANKIASVITITQTNESKFWNAVGLSFSPHVFVVKQQKQTGPTIARIYCGTTLTGRLKYFEIEYTENLYSALKPVPIAIAMMFMLKFAYPELVTSLTE